jgi:hypothetical protein
VTACQSRSSEADQIRFARIRELDPPWRVERKGVDRGGLGSWASLASRPPAAAAARSLRSTATPGPAAKPPSRAAGNQPSVAGSGGGNPGGAAGPGGGGAGGGAAGSGAASGLTGLAILTVPFTGPGQSVEFLIPFGYKNFIDLSTAAEVTFRLCAASAPDPNGTFVQPAVKNEASGIHAGSATPIASGVSACPTMSDVTLGITGGTLDAKTVNAFSLTVGTSANAAHVSAPTILHLDAVTISDNVIGPYDFRRNTDPLALTDAGKVGATITASSPDTSPSSSPGGALLTIPPFANGSSNSFGLFFGTAVDLSGPATQIAYRMCTVSPQSVAQIQVSSVIQDLSLSSRTAQALTADVIGTCPTLTTHSFAVSDHSAGANGTLDEAHVFILALLIKTGSAIVSPSQIFIDSISVTNDPVGPYDFTFNRHPMELGSAGTGAALDWLAAPPSARE